MSPAFDIEDIAFVAHYTIVLKDTRAYANALVGVRS